MKLSISELLDIISYGYYSAPVVYALLEEKEADYLQEFMEYHKWIWHKNYKKAYAAADAGVKKCESAREEFIISGKIKENIDDETALYLSKSLYFLLYSFKMGSLVSLYGIEPDNKHYIEEAKMIYNDIYSRIKEIPLTARRLVITNMKGNYAYLNDETLPDIEIKSCIYKEDSSYTFHKYGEAAVFVRKAKELRKNNIYEGYEENVYQAVVLYYDGLEHAKRMNHPSGITKGLNQIAWYLRDIEPEKSLKITKELSYSIGLYFEDMAYNFQDLDTCFDVFRINKNIDIFDISHIISCFYKTLQNDEKNRYSKDMFKDKVKIARNYVLNLNHKKYPNSETLRKCLYKLTEKNNIKDYGISKRRFDDILSGKTEFIFSSSLRKIISFLKPELNINASLPMIQEIIKAGLEDKLETYIPEFISMNKNNRLSYFLSVYMALCEKEFINLESFLLDLLETDPAVFIEFIKKEEEFKMIKIVVSIFEPLQDFFEARKFLCSNFLNKISEKNLISDFFMFYKNLSIENKIIFDEFARNYARYSFIKWGVRFKAKPEFEKFRKKFKLDKNIFIIAFYAFEEEKRVKFLEIVKNNNV